MTAAVVRFVTAAGGTRALEADLDRLQTRINELKGRPEADKIEPLP